MRSLSRLLMSVVLLFTASALQAASPGCGAMEFSEAVLARFPNAPRACLDVVNREGDAYGVFKANIVRVQEMGNEIDLRFKLPDGSKSDVRKLKTSPDLRVMVRGKPTRVNDLVVGDEITAYVKMHEPVLALAPAEESEAPQFNPILPAEEPQQRVAAAMPTTASYTFLIGLAGGMFWMLATVLFVQRSSRSKR